MITFAAKDGVYIVNETFSVTFNCSATGIPPPTIQWLKNNSILNVTANSSRFLLGNATVSETPGEVSMVTRMLTINNAMETDNGTYTCVANNSAVSGEDQEDFELYVQSKLLSRNGIVLLMVL